MRNLLLWILLYTLTLASSQIFLKLGVSEAGQISFKSINDLIPTILDILKSPLLILGTTLMGASFLLWVYILSWFKLGLVFPLTAITYIFVALLSFLFLGERLSAINYGGIVLVATGIFFLLYK